MATRTSRIGTDKQAKRKIVSASKFSRSEYPDGWRCRPSVKLVTERVKRVLLENYVRFFLPVA